MAIVNDLTRTPRQTNPLLSNTPGQITTDPVGTPQIQPDPTVTSGKPRAPVDLGNSPPTPAAPTTTPPTTPAPTAAPAPANGTTTPPPAAGTSLIRPADQTTPPPAPYPKNGTTTQIPDQPITNDMTRPGGTGAVPTPVSPPRPPVVPTVSGQAPIQGGTINANPNAQGVPQLLVGSDATAPGVYKAPTMTFAPQQDLTKSGNYATQTSGPLAGLNDDQLFTLIAYGTDPALKAQAQNAVWNALGGNTGNYNAWINSFNGPKEVSLGDTTKVSALMQQLGTTQNTGLGANGQATTGPSTGIVNSAVGGTQAGAPGTTPTNGGVQPNGQPAQPGQTGSTGNTTNQFGVSNDLNTLDAAPTADYEPVMAQVDANQTVQGQLSNILAAGSPLLEGAKARAIQAANARGLGNTSMAAQAGEEATVNAALPIAQQDAATYQKQALANQDITNQFLSQKEGAVIDLTKAYEAFKQSNLEFDKDEALKKYINDSSNTTQEKVAAMQQAASFAATAASLSNAKTAADAQLAATGMTTTTQRAISQAGLDAQAAQNLLQVKSNNFTHYVDSVQQVQLSQIPADAKATQLRNLNAQYAGAPMPDGFQFVTTVLPADTTTPPAGS